MLRTTSLRDITGVTMLPGDVQGNITTDINTSSFLTGQPDSKEDLNVFNELLDNQNIDEYDDIYPIERFNEGLEDAFNLELVDFLNEIDLNKVPPNYFSFYEKNLSKEKSELTKIKINNKILLLLQINPIQI